MTTVGLPGGGTATFPDSMTPDQITAALKQQFPSQAASTIQPGGRTTLFPTKTNAPFTGDVLPISRDVAGSYHPAVPEFIASPVRGAVSMGERALGMGEEGQNPLRPLTPDELGAVMMGSPASVARGTGSMISGLRATAGPSPAQSRLADFQGAGITPNMPAVSQGRYAGALANASRVLPFSPVQRGIERNLGEAQTALGSRAGELGAPQDIYGAGSVAGNALKRFTADKSDAQQGYGKFFGLMQGAPEGAIPNTLQVLGQMKKAYPNAPELTDVFTSPPILRMANALEPRQVNIPARTSPMLDPYGRPVVTAPAQTVQRGGKLSIDEIKNMRSQIGEKLEHPTIGPDSIPRGQLKQLYGALTKDMYAMARAHSPAAERALNDASQQHRLRMGIIDRLDRMTNKDAPESVFFDINRAATDGAGQDAKLLSTIKRVLTPQEWGDVGASIVQRLGNPHPGQMPAPGQPAFSLGNLTTNWNKLTPKAKDLIFGKDTPGSTRAGLEQLSRAAASLKNVSRLANKSHTYENMTAIGIVGELLSQVSIGRMPIPELAGYASAYGVSHLMMSPAFTKWVYKLPSVINGAPPMMASSLAMAALRQTIGQETGRERHQDKPKPIAPPKVQQKLPPASDNDFIEPPPRASVTGP